MKLRTFCLAVLAAGILLSTAATAAAGNIAVLHSFSGVADGGSPNGRLVDGGDGFLYGAAASGGSLTEGAPDGHGTIYRIGAAGPLETLYTFDRVNGQTPQGLTPAGDGTYYGTTSHGGHPDPNIFYGGYGTLFRFDPATRQVTKLWEIWPVHGAWPSAPPTIGPDGALYGTGRYGGAFQYYGTVWRWTAETGLQVIHDFNLADGKSPLGPLTVGSDGYLYGTTSEGGNGCGTVFRISTTGEFHSFGLGVGCKPQGGVVQASDGNFYGTTTGTGSGTVFRMTPAGEFSLVYQFDYAYAATGAKPAAQLYESADGYLYGTTTAGGVSGNGVVFRIDRAGKFELLHEFTRGDGGSPTAITQWTDGQLYGVAGIGGTYDRGVVYRLAPVVKATLGSISLSATTVRGGSNVIATVRLSAPAPAGGAAVAVSSDSRSVNVPSSVTVPQGASSVQFTVGTKRVNRTTTATITASYDGVARSATLTLTK